MKMSLLPADTTSEEKEHQASASVTSNPLVKDDMLSIENLVHQAPQMCLTSPKMSKHLPPPYDQTNKTTTCSSVQTQAGPVDESTSTVLKQPKPVSAVSHHQTSVALLSLGENPDSIEHATISTPSGEKKPLIILIPQNKPDDATGSTKRAVCTTPSHQANQTLSSLLTTSSPKSTTTSRLSCSRGLPSETDSSLQLTTISRSEGQAVADVSCSVNSSSAFIESSAPNHKVFHEDDTRADVPYIFPKIGRKSGKVFRVLVPKPVRSDKSSTARQDSSTMHQNAVYDKSNFMLQSTVQSLDTLNNASSESKSNNTKVSLPLNTAITNKLPSSLYVQIVSLPDVQNMPPVSTASLLQNSCNPSDDKVELTTKSPSGLTVRSSSGKLGRAPPFIVTPSESLASSLPFNLSNLNQDTSQNLSTGLHSAENLLKNKQNIIPISAPSNFSFTNSRSAHMKTLTKQVATMKGANPAGKTPVLVFKTAPLAAPAVSKANSCYELLESVNRRALEQVGRTGDETFPERILPSLQISHFGSQPTCRKNTQLLPLPSTVIPKLVGAGKDVKEEHENITTKEKYEERTLNSTCVKTVEGSQPVTVITPVLKESQSNFDDVNSSAFIQSSYPAVRLNEEFQQVRSDEVKDLAFAQKGNECFGIKIESVFSLSGSADMSNDNDMNEEQGLQQNNIDILGKTFQSNEKFSKMTDPSTESAVEFPTFNLRTSSDWINFCIPSFVVLHKLSPREVNAARLQKTEPRCSDHCRKRHLDNLCHLNLLKCINHPDLTGLLRVKKPRLMDKNYLNGSTLSLSINKPTAVNNLEKETCTPSKTYMGSDQIGSGISTQLLKDNKYVVDTKTIMPLPSKFLTQEPKADEKDSILIEDQNFQSPNSQAAIDMFGDQLPVDFKEQLLVLKKQVALKRSQMFARRLSCRKGKDTQLPSLSAKNFKTKLMPPTKKISLLKGKIMERLKMSKTPTAQTTKSVLTSFPGHEGTDAAEKSKKTVSVDGSEGPKPPGVHVPKVSIDKIQAALTSLSQHIATTGKKLNDGRTGYIIMKIDGQHVLVKLPVTSYTEKLPQSSAKTLVLKSHHPLAASAPTQVRNLELKPTKIINTSTGKLQLDVRSLCSSRNVKAASISKPASQPIPSSSAATHNMGGFIQTSTAKSLNTAHKPSQYCPTSLPISTSFLTSEQINRSVSGVCTTLCSTMGRTLEGLASGGSKFQTKALIKQTSCTEVPAMKVSDVSGKLPKVQRSMESLPAQEKSARRKALEKKYPLPPGVVIKSEPDDSGYEVDNNWFVTSEVNAVTVTEQPEKDRANHTHNHQSSELCTRTGGEIVDVVDDAVFKNMDDDRTSSDSLDEPPPLIQEPSMNRVGSKGASEEAIVDDMPPVLHPMAPSLYSSSCLRSNSGTDSPSQLNREQDDLQPLNLASIGSPSSEGSESSQRNWDSGVELSTSMASSSVSSLLSESGQPQIPSSSSTKIQHLKELLKQREQEIESFRKLRCKLPPLDLEKM